MARGGIRWRIVPLRSSPHGQPSVTDLPRLHGLTLDVLVNQADYRTQHHRREHYIDAVILELSICV